MSHQHYWCCAHHPSAIDNFFGHRTTCEWSCHTQNLRWFDHGKRPMPKSWGDNNASKDWRIIGP